MPVWFAHNKTTRNAVFLQDRRAHSNKLLDSLPQASRKRLLAVAEPVALEYKQVLATKGGALTHAFFPTTSFISLLVPSDKGRIEVAIVGREGLFGLGVAFGVRESDVEAIVQGAGAALKVSAPDLRRFLKDDRAFRERLDRYAYVMLNVLARNAACNRFHRVEQRMARWLLMSADRAQSAMFDITHAFLAEMLGVRRVGVTTTANKLQDQGLITYSRGTVAIRDRDGLKRLACGCYREDHETYKKHFG